MPNKNYTVFHCHSFLSNPTTVMDSVTNYKLYVDRAKELGMKAIAISEHGNMFEYLHKKEYIEKHGLKYIHAVEAYVTKSLDEKIRDNYHTILIARNFDGFKELNYLMSDKVANNRGDGHFYYVPRITYEELKNTSNNIIITSACLGSILNSGDNELELDFIDFMKSNKHRCFLEIQHHNVEDQIKYNQKLLNISRNTGIHLIAGTDTHSLNEEYAEGRIVLQRAKNTYFENEEGWDLTFKTYEELVESYESQNSISQKDYLQAIENTNLLIEMVEPFELDRGYKYPQLYDDSETTLKKKIVQGIKDRGIKLDKVKKDRITHELNTMKNNHSIDYILLEEDYKSWCRENGIPYGYGRGSVSGSYIAYLLKITEMDSIKHNLIFERFMNPHRINLCDIDTDLPPSQRGLVKDYIYNKKGLYCADVITFNTIALKGAIRDVGRALDMSLHEVDAISKNIDSDESNLRKEYPELFKYADLLSGVVTSVGTHPAGVVVSPFPLEDSIGTCTLSTNDYPVTLLNMNELEDLNFVKLDLLGLDNIEIINQTCKYVGIEVPTPDTIDTNDKRVWDSIRDSTLGVFQWESDTASSYYKRLFSDETVNKIKERNPDFNYIDLFSMGNGAIRPAGESYRNALAKGEYRDNGHELLDDFLSPTLHYIVFQEQIIEFLNKFCGFSLGEADIVRRGFSSKSGTNEYIPSIKEGFIKTMSKKHGVCKDEAEELIVDFIRVIEDASDYLFSINHSQSYSYIGYVCAWLRYYYPLEFLTSLLNVRGDNQEKTNNALEYMNNHTNITLNPIKFGYSGADYRFDKETNSIYKGIASIKYLNEQVGNDLQKLGRDNKYDTFYDVMVDLTTKMSIDSRQLRILTTLNFFDEFGNNQKLLKYQEIFSELYGIKQLSKAKGEKLGLPEDLLKKYSRETAKTYMDFQYEGVLRSLWHDIEDTKLPLREQIEAEKEYLSYIEFIEPRAGDNFYIVTEFKTYKNKNRPYITLYRLNNGETIKTKVVDGKFYALNPFKMYNLIRVDKFKTQKKNRLIDGKWQKIDETEDVLDNWQVF